MEPTSSSSYPDPLQSKPHYEVRFALQEAARASQLQELQALDIDSWAPKGDYRHGLLSPEKFEQLTDAIVASGLGITFDFILRVPPGAMSKDPEALAWLKGPRPK